MAPTSGFSVERPIDEVATWDLEIGWTDEIAKLQNDLVWSCADFVARLPGVDDVEYEGDVVIFVYGSVSEDDLRAPVAGWLAAHDQQRPSE